MSNYSVRAEAQRLQAEGVDILIALGHSGYELDQQLAEEVEEIDVVVGGHSHTFLWTGKHSLWQRYKIQMSYGSNERSIRIALKRPTPS